jgi:gamma-glutamyl-gamma-aminobutyrate hydrolase PuuD
MAEILGEPIIKVNSLHHQGLKDIAPSLRVAGHAPDGLVEAVELPDHPFGLQFNGTGMTADREITKFVSKFVKRQEGKSYSILHFSMSISSHSPIGS